METGFTCFGIVLPLRKASLSCSGVRRVRVIVPFPRGPVRCRPWLKRRSGCKTIPRSRIFTVDRADLLHSHLSDSRRIIAKNDNEKRGRVKWPALEPGALFPLSSSSTNVDPRKWRKAIAKRQPMQPSLLFSWLKALYFPFYVSLSLSLIPPRLPFQLFGRVQKKLTDGTKHGAAKLSFRRSFLCRWNGGKRERERGWWKSRRFLADGPRLCGSESR